MKSQERARTAHAAPLHSCKYRRLHAGFSLERLMNLMTALDQDGDPDGSLFGMTPGPLGPVLVRDRFNLRSERPHALRLDAVDADDF